MKDTLLPIVRVLLIEDDEDDSFLIRSHLSSIASASYDVTWAATYKDAVRELTNGTYDVCLLDYRLGHRTGIEILQNLHDVQEKPPIIILTGQGSYKIDIQAMKLGAADFLVKDYLNEPILERTIRYAIERRKSEAALRASEKQLEFLSSQLLVVQESERRKVATELHDNLSQLLTAIKYNIETVMSRMPPGDACSFDLEPIIPLIQVAVEHVRSIYTQLRPTILDDLGIIATLTWFCREFEQANKTISIVKQLDADEAAIPNSLKLTIFRIVQDAMSNIARHGDAHNVWLSLSKDGRSLRLSIRDDGKGFDLEAALVYTEGRNGLGLISMKRRAELSGGNFEIKSAPGAGTTVSVAWPLVAFA